MMILKKDKKIVVEHLGVEEAKIQRITIDDLKGSLDTGTVIAFEEEFGCENCR